MPEINFKVKNGITVTGLAGNANEIVTLAADGTLVASDITVSSISGDYVNVTGDTMTGNLAMSGAGIQLDINYEPPHQEGRIFYDGQSHTLSYFNDNPDVKINVGQEEVVRVRNNTGSTILNGRVVCISGSSGSNPLIVLADNTDPSLSHRTLGIATHDISDNENGYVTVSGLVNGLNTNSFSTEGITLWLGTNGQITETEPTAPIHKVKIGYLIRKHNTQGIILVAIDTGLDLKDLHDVSIGDYDDGALLVANGAVWSPGANINDLATKVEVANISGGFDNRITNLEDINYVENEPTGFENRADSTISYNPTTRVFSISGNYNVWLDAVKYSKTGDSTTLTATYGVQFIKYGAGGVFSVSNTPWSLNEDAPIAYAFFNSGATDSFIAEERHGITMDGVTHRYLHFTQGARYRDGFGIGDYILNSDTPANNQYSVATGRFFDEDIENTVSALANGGPYNIFYRNGASGEWTWSRTEAYPYFINANSIRYNQFTGATWQLTDITTNNRWVNYYVFATNALTSGFGIIIIPGQNIYTSLALAQAESVANLSLGDLPFQEIIAVGRITHQFSTGYANANGRARIVAVSSLLGQSVTIQQTVTNHNGLGGLQGGTVGEYFHLTSSQSNDFIGRTEVANISGGLNTRISTLETNTANITGGLTQLDARYVNVTGDTMTGNLIITSDTSDPALQINSDGDARIRLNNPAGAGRQTYAELSFAYENSDQIGLYVDSPSSETLPNSPVVGLYNYKTGKDIFTYYTLDDTIVFTPRIKSTYLSGVTDGVITIDADGTLTNSGLLLSDFATTTETDTKIYNLDVGLQAQISNVFNPAEVANISGSSITIDSFPHYSEKGMVKWFIHLDDGTNQRASEVMVTYIPNSTIKFAEQSVESIGTTTDAVLSATTDSTNVYLKLTSSNLWNFKTKRINL